MSGRLRVRFHCIALDRVGYRRSGALDRLTTVEEQVAAIAAVHDACTAEALPEIAARMSELLPNGELAILEGQNHGAPMAAPDVVAQRTVEYTDRVRTSEA